MPLYKIPQKLAITACLIEGESSGCRQILKTCELFLCSKRKLGLVKSQSDALNVYLVLGNSAKLKRDSFSLRNTKECSMSYRQSETYSHKIPQKLTTTVCFIQEESSGGRQFRKHVSCFYAQRGHVVVLSSK